MAYELFDLKGNIIKLNDTEDKNSWCKVGERIEEAFIRIYGSDLNLKINPEKEGNPFAPDLVYGKQEHFADLKTQNTPFFIAQSKFGISPSYAIVFNEKDKIRYSKYYSDILIYFWVNWRISGFQFKGNPNSKIEIPPMNSIFGITFQNLLPLLTETNKHEYARRKEDKKGNAKASYVLDVRNEAFTKMN